MTRHGGWLALWIVLPVAACGGGAGGGDAGGPDSSTHDSGSRDATGDTGATDSSRICTSDEACDDGLFCNGAETCAPDHPLADPRGCVPQDTRPCVAGQTCDEDADRCLTMCDLTGDADGDGHDSLDCGGDDCDDSDANRYPGNVERCDAEDLDEDCNPETYGDKDFDGDGVVDSACCNTRADGTRACGGDCDDLMRTTHPTSPEVCDGRDNDCNGSVDDGVRVDGYADMDGDLHGDPAAPLSGCPGDGRFASAGDDCDDTDPRRHPGQLEVCDGVDDDCNGSVDDGAGSAEWYPDTDGDGYGDPDGPPVSSCRRPAGHSLLASDCDDGDPARNPGSAEVCDGRDNDCDGVADFEIGGAGSGDFEDDDRDGFPDSACAAAGVPADCDDGDPSAHPGAAEICDDGVDNDCDGVIDSGCSPADWYPDADGDGYGDESAVPTRSMTPVPGSVNRAGDCDDADGDRNPGMREVCDGVDNDCDGVVDGNAARYCSGAHALMSCRSAACTLRACERGWDDCDGDPNTGCETNTDASPTACGTCGTICFDGLHGAAACTAGSCDLACDPGYANCDGDLASGCEVDASTDAMNCGRCGMVCSARPHASPTCVAGSCGVTCDAGWADCDSDATNGCEVHVDRDAAHCGACGGSCTVAGDVCVGGSCVANPFPSDGSEGSFTPTADVVLSAGVHQFTTISIPAGVTVRVAGDGWLDLRATGDVTIDGVVDLSGGDGAPGLESASGCGGTCGGGGGGTGTTLAGAAATATGCGAPGAGGLGVPGRDGSASMGTGTGLPCRAGGANGGGVGAPGGTCRFAGGAGGGGGFAGGGGGGCPGASGGDGASAGADIGGVGSTTTGTSATAGGGGQGTGVYAGQAGSVSGGATPGGGGSIGDTAAADLAVTTTFQPGSGGGGGGAPDTSTPSGGGGGGGGGGALRIASPTSVTVRGRLLAVGGRGGDAPVGGVSSGAGGGGSGGLIYLAAPTLTIAGSADVWTGGGRGGTGWAGNRGGDGGLGRVRLMTLPDECTINGNLIPTTVSACTPIESAGHVYIATWPN